MSYALVLGGLDLDRSRHLLRALVADVNLRFVRVVDRFLVVPPSLFTCYCDNRTKDAFANAIRDGKLQYMQANLLVEASRTKVFAVPEGCDKWDYCFDFSGETDATVTDEVHYERTYRLALSLANQAVGVVNSYLRPLEPFYKAEKGKSVGDEGVTAQPWGSRAEWQHATARALSTITNLKLVLIRPAIMYGPGSVTGVAQRTLLARLYAFTGERLDFLWSGELAQSTVHVDDYASALLAIAHYSHERQLAQLNQEAGENLDPLASGSSVRKMLVGKKDALATQAVMDGAIRRPVLTVCDDGQTTQRKIADAVGAACAVETGFHSLVVNTFARANLGDVVEEANEKHMAAWGDLLVACDPPLKGNMPISVSVSEDVLRPYPVLLSNAKLKALTKWQPQDRLSAQALQEMIKGFQDEGLWPNATSPRRKSKK